MRELLLTRKDVFQYLHWILYGDFNLLLSLKNYISVLIAGLNVNLMVQNPNLLSEDLKLLVDHFEM